MGPLGQKTVQYLLQRKTIEIVGAIDVNPELLGRDVVEVVRCESIGVTIQLSTNSDLNPLRFLTMQRIWPHKRPSKSIAIAWSLARQLQAPHYIEEAVIEFMAVVVQTAPAAAKAHLVSRSLVE